MSVVKYLGASRNWDFARAVSLRLISVMIPPFSATVLRTRPFCRDLHTRSQLTCLISTRTIEVLRLMQNKERYRMDSKRKGKEIEKMKWNEDSDRERCNR